MVWEQITDWTKCPLPANGETGNAQVLLSVPVADSVSISQTEGSGHMCCSCL